MRTIIELPETSRDELDALSRRLGISRAEAIRRTVSEYLTEHRSADHDDLFGIWKHRDIDAPTREDDLRAEWERR